MLYTISTPPTLLSSWFLLTEMIFSINGCPLRDLDMKMIEYSHANVDNMTIVFFYLPM